MSEETQHGQEGLTFDEMMRLHKAHLEGLQRGRELAMQQYDKAFLELADKMDHIVRKLDAVLEAKER